MESKQYVTQGLFDLLKLTREYGSELVRLDYIKSDAEEVVVAEFISGSTKTINVHMDSGLALIKDVLPRPGGRRMGSLKGNPDFIVYEFWIDSQLSVARFYGGCQYNGEYYVIDLETGDLVRAEYHATYIKKHKPKRLEESAYAKARARGEV